MAEQDKNIRVLYLAEIGKLLPPDCLREGNGRKLRSTPIPWLKFRSPADTTPDGGRYTKRRQAVKADDDGMAVLGIYDEVLLAYGADQIAPLRGYLVNHHLRPASVGEIAVAVCCFDRQLVEHALEVLLGVGLLVWREMPDFAAAIKADKTLAPHDDPPDEPDDSLFADEAPKGRRRRPRARAARRYGHGKAAELPTAPPLPPAGTGPQPAGSVPATCQQPARQPLTDVRPQTPDVTPDTSDGRPETPAASAAPSPPSETGSGKTGQSKPETDPAAARPGQTTAGDAPPPHPPDGQTADGAPKTGDTPVPQAGPADDPTAEPITIDVEADDVQPLDPAARADSSDPLHPTEADPKGAAASRAPAGPPAQPRRGPSLDWHAERFAEGVFNELYPNEQDILQQSRRRQKGALPVDEFIRTEKACFARAFESLLPELNQVEALELQRWAMKTAKQAHRTKCRWTRGHWWRWRFGEHAAKVRRGLASGPPPGGA